ncbi:hypothetical protein [uncultured Tenacibaculum sp.]|uniref:hypothetical protein n=1 Tax=uncultured Tenacibaculum sp. TaxID=174713 RepID=UPI00261956CE|nr:hypothetical protein [uncultured Tenacibaculum sp.]
MEEPKFRCGTRGAITSLAKTLELPYSDLMQDWSYEVANPNDIEKYIKHYDKLTDEDQKFVLMQIMIQATTDQSNKDDLQKYWNEISTRLLFDKTIHEYTIFYWGCYEEDIDINDCWEVTPFIRNLWEVMQKSYEK